MKGYMMKVRHMNALLVEILMAVLFFALAAVVILELFTTGYSLSARADAVDRAVNHAQQISEQLYAAEDMAQALRQNGFDPAQESWQLEGEDYALQVRVSAEETAAGEMHTAQITILVEGEEAICLPCARYACGEVAR